MSDFSHLFKESVDLLISEYMKDENKMKVEKNILDPVVIYLGQKLWPYILTFSIVLCVVFILLIYILFKIGIVKEASSVSSVSSMNA